MKLAQLQSMDVKMETGHATYHVLRSIQCTPVMIGAFFAVEVSRMVPHPPQGLQEQGRPPIKRTDR
eukprot:1153701-Pelagomonas_calceolata.AAC.3